MVEPIYSAQTLAERALRKIGVLMPGQSAPAEDMLIVTDKIDGLLAALNAAKVYPALSVEEIDIAAFDHVATCLAVACLDEFAAPASERQLWEAKRREAERLLRVINQSGPPFSVLEADYF